MHTKNIIRAGKTVAEAGKAVIMLHGRGSSAEDILSLAEYLNLDEYALIAPQAAGHTWYPYSFLAPPSQNEPDLSSALALIKEIVSDLEAERITKDNLYFLGFSQGACLATEFIARNADRYGGAALFTGGLIGDRIYKENYRGDFGQMPVFIGSSDPDPHVPAERVHASIELLKAMNASVTGKIYKKMGHTINVDEIALANELVFGKKDAI